METKNIKFNHKGKKIYLNLKICRGLWEGIGLMVSRREKGEALLFEFKKPVKMAIHSWFVFFPFVAIWFDENNKIIEIKLVKPFENYILPKKSFTKLIEIPINKKYQEVISLLVDTRKI